MAIRVAQGWSRAGMADVVRAAICRPDTAAHESAASLSGEWGNDFVRKVGKNRNTLAAKAGRVVTAVLLPVSKTRRGKCRRCGSCCKLPFTCPFLRYNSVGESYCRVYRLRPPSCRKYPRVDRELITGDTCGFYFD